jgi:hypothetical protein
LGTFGNPFFGWFIDFISIHDEFLEVGTFGDKGWDGFEFVTG